MIVWIQGLLRQPARFLAMIVAEPTHDASGRWLPGFGDNVWWRCRWLLTATGGRKKRRGPKDLESYIRFVGFMALNGADPRLLDDGSRWVDAAALRMACGRVGGQTP